MDGLSIVAAIAGVASAGIRLSTALYDLIASIRDAPKAMKDVARGISDMSVVLYELRRILRKHGELFKRRLLSRLDSAAKRVRAVHGEVRSMIRRSDAVVARVLWVFRQAKVLQLLSMIEGIKSGVGIMLQTMVLAVHPREIPRCVGSFRYMVVFIRAPSRSNAGTRRPLDAEQSTYREERSCLRREAENLVRITRQSLLDLAVEQSQQHLSSSHSPDGVSEDGNRGEFNDEALGDNDTPNSGPDDTAAWLYETVFASLDGSEDSQGPFGINDNRLALLLDSTSRVNLADSPDTQSQTGSHTSNKETSSDSEPSNALVRLADMLLEETVEQAAPPFPIIDQLLSEWTNLSENEIKEVDNKDAKKEKAESIKLKDKSGRKFTIPFHKANTWKVSGL
jgi:hypothetical protein